MRAQLKMCMQGLNHIIRIRIFQHPLFKDLIPKPFKTASDKDDSTTIFYRMSCIVQCFLRLVQVEILWCTTLGHDDNIRFCGNRTAVDIIQIGTGITMCLNGITGYAVDDLFTGIQHDIDNKINPRHLSRLFDITTDRIIIQISGTCTWIHHHSVIHGNGRNGRYARHDCLGTPGIPRKIMEFHIPKTDSSICLYNSGINIHRRTG